MTIAPPDRQALLLDVIPEYRCNSIGQARNAYGQAAMEIVCRTMALTPIRINGNFDVCLDAEKDGIYYEIKSVHSKSKILVYDFRLKKERESKLPIRYAFLIHDVRNVKQNVLATMLGCAPQIIVMELAYVVAAAAEEPLKKPKIRKYTNRVGYYREGYADGYRHFPPSKLLDYPHQVITDCHL